MIPVVSLAPAGVSPEPPHARPGGTACFLPLLDLLMTANPAAGAALPVAGTVLPPLLPDAPATADVGEAGSKDPAASADAEQDDEPTVGNMPGIVAAALAIPSPEPLRPQPSAAAVQPSVAVVVNPLPTPPANSSAPMPAAVPAQGATPHVHAETVTAAFTPSPPPDPTIRPVPVPSGEDGEVGPPVDASPPSPIQSPARAPEPATVQPALQAFSAALHRAVADERRPAARLADPAPAAASVASSPTLIAPVADPTPLDTTQPRWPEAMMARIEQIRDAQNATDTRVRLHPDALGVIDVSVSREGEAVRVHLAAAEPATRALLADAQPRLAELAEARGLKLAQSAVDGGSAGEGGERRQPAQPQPPSPARPPAGIAAEPDSDNRLA